jgi:hypothetical protein
MQSNIPSWALYPRKFSYTELVTLSLAFHHRVDNIFLYNFFIKEKKKIPNVADVPREKFLMWHMCHVRKFPTWHVSHVRKYHLFFSSLKKKKEIKNYIFTTNINLFPYYY